MTNSCKSVAEQQKNIENATRAKCPLVDSDLKFGAYTFYSCSKADMDAKTLKWAFKLAERNVSPFYKELAMGWQPKVKQNDLNKNWARYLVALDSNRQPVAYAMFRFDLDYGHAVLYCYELQIEAASQRQGLGKFIMSALEKCASQRHMEKVVLTVLKNNENAVCFFKATGYNIDDSSPDILEKAEYEILSKSIMN